MSQKQWRPKDWGKHSMDEIVKLPTDVYPLLIPSSLEWDIQRKRLFEAGADAMLEALLDKGLKVNNISPEHSGKGTVIFIPDEE